MLTIKQATLAVMAVVTIATFTPIAARAADYLSFAAGWYDGIRRIEPAAQFGLEYRFEPVQYYVQPMLGAFGTSKGASYVYGGLNWDLPLLADRLYLLPNFAIGWYNDGNGRKMGGPLEFRSGLELDYQFCNAHRIGIGINHISNAHIYPHNRGEETIFINYSLPIGPVFRP